MKEEVVRQLLEDQWSAKPMKPFTVRIPSELWDTESSDTLRPGGRVKVIDMENLILKVKKISTNII